MLLFVYVKQYSLFWLTLHLSHCNLPKSLFNFHNLSSSFLFSASLHFFTFYYLYVPFLASPVILLVPHLKRNIFTTRGGSTVLFLPRPVDDKSGAPLQTATCTLSGSTGSFHGSRRLSQEVTLNSVASQRGTSSVELCGTPLEKHQRRKEGLPMSSSWATTEPSVEQGTLRQ